ncbi:MAG: hypothetical protein BIP78_0187 [Candidatus Bipolaricaulis sibiricus]|uniref:Uncharacterized protein n=1 Tax=Bipolaricaulis sibiricus TaxID=2501609 RepID=A0A410FS81_BIPS1|nr:MAG: hypothetical protein BIP78_0187 [Candidatus Bipolaricaulis sibiricus]
MGWKDRLRREFFEADREFVDTILPVGSVDRAAFGLLADATRYVLVEEAGEVHLRAEIAAQREVLASLARAGAAVKAPDAQEAVARFAALWEAKARHRGTWDAAVAHARQGGEVEQRPRDVPAAPGGSFWSRLWRRRPPREGG